MIYPHLRVPVPDAGGYEQCRNGVVYRYVYCGERRVNSRGRSSHPPSRMIGRIERDANGQSVLMPNEAYFELMGLPRPDVAEAEGPGRKQKVRSQASQALKALKALNGRPASSEGSPSYGIVVLKMLAELGVTACLKKAFSEEIIGQIQATVAFLCASARTSFEGLSYFVQDHKCFGVDPQFDHRRAGELLVRLSLAQRDAFYEAWIRQMLRQESEDRIFYDFYEVTSYSACAENLRQAAYGYTHDHDDLRQINHGLYCSRKTGIQLYMNSYHGSLNDKSNFNETLRRADALGLHLKTDRIVIITDIITDIITKTITDAGLCGHNFSWTHFLNCKLLAGVPVHQLKDVRQAYLEWSRQLSPADESKAFFHQGNAYLSSYKPFTMAGVTGTLLMFKNLTKARTQADECLRERQKLSDELDAATTWEGTSFEVWTRPCQHYFRLTAHGKTGFTYEPREEALREELELCGAFTFFTTLDLKICSPLSLLKMYRTKEDVEDSFDTTKKALCDERFYVRGDRQVEGKLFLLFLSSILYRGMQLRLKQWLLDTNSTMHGAMEQLQRTKHIRLSDGTWVLEDTLTQEQRALIDALKLDLNALPEEPATKPESSSTMPRRQREPRRPRRGTQGSRSDN